MEKFAISFYCYFPGNPNPCKHYQSLTIAEIPKWIECYRFTHPNCTAISIKFWLKSEIEGIEI